MSPAPAPVPRASLLASYDWPRTYRNSLHGIALHGILGLSSLGAAIAIGVHLVRPHHESALAVALLAALVLCCLVFTVWFLAEAWTGSVTLTPDRIVSRSALGSRELALESIAGRRQRAANGMVFVTVVPRDARAHRIDVASGLLAVDEAFAAWMLTLPDLDDAERAAEIERALVDSAPAVSLEALGAELADSKRLALAFTVWAAVVCAWTAFHPAPYVLAVSLCALTAVAAIAICVAAPRRFAFANRAHDPRADLSFAFLLTSAVTGLRALSDVNPLISTTLLAPGALLGLVCWGGYYLAMRAHRLRRFEGIIEAMLFVFWGLGVMTDVDALLDRAPPRYYEPRVVARADPHVRAASRHLRVEPWGPPRAPVELVASKRFYEETHVGDRVCVTLHRGALGVPWFSVTRAPCSAALTDARTLR